MINFTNIPTELLRTFVSVVELRSYTRAAQAQGVTQPAVSAQIRRLQNLLEIDLLDKSAPGVSLTAKGEMVLSAARRMLALNDQILQISKPAPSSQMVRVGVPGDCMGAELARVLAASRTQWPHLRFAIQGGGQKRLLHGLQENEFDLVVALVVEDPGDTARYSWTEELVWVRGKSTALDAEAPVPLVSYKDVCVCHRVAVSTLTKIGRPTELVFRASNAEALQTAVAAGIGVMAVPRRRVPPSLEVWERGPLPALPDVHCGIFLRADAEWEVVEQLADRIADTLSPPDFVKTAPPPAARAAKPVVPAGHRVFRSA
jgi:DNA-binding transcriptional LysR family regulator